MILSEVKEAWMPLRALNNQVKMPLLGFGVFQITDIQAVLHASKTGYSWHVFPHCRNFLTFSLLDFKNEI